METVLAYIQGEDADFFNLLDAAVESNPRAAGYRLTYLAAAAVQELADHTGERPAEVLERLLEERIGGAPGGP